VLAASGATTHAEFYAVPTETFFEKPDALKKGYPELYELLEEFYGARPDD
jgi:Mlc titration factor MtfA (ptsG expression regulator)